MKNNFSMGSFMRLNRMNLLMCSAIVIINVFITGVGVGVSGEEGIANAIKNVLLSMSMMFVPLYVILSSTMNSIITVPKGIILSTPRKKLCNSVVANDVINIVGAMIITCVVNFLVNGVLKLNGVSTDFTANLKFIGLIMLQGMFLVNLIEYIIFMFMRFNVYYGLANIFVLIGIVFYFGRDIYFMVQGGNVLFLSIGIVIALILLLYVNRILMNKLEIRG